MVSVDGPFVLQLDVYNCKFTWIGVPDFAE